MNWHSPFRPRLGGFVFSGSLGRRGKDEPDGGHADGTVRKGFGEFAVPPVLAAVVEAQVPCPGPAENAEGHGPARGIGSPHCCADGVPGEGEGAGSGGGRGEAGGGSIDPQGGEQGGAEGPGSGIHAERAFLPEGTDRPEDFVLRDRAGIPVMQDGGAAEQDCGDPDPRGMGEGGIGAGFGESLLEGGFGCGGERAVRTC